MLRVTFYSYKGGVGRTLALLNVAKYLARSGRRVVAIDLDLEAPGFGLSGSTYDDRHQHGVSDFLLERRALGTRPLADYAYPVLQDVCGDNLLLMPVGRRGRELVHRIPSFYADPSSDDAELFQLLIAELHGAYDPDYLFFDSHTGLADVAGVCTTELPEVLVAVCGLNAQNVTGMRNVLEELSTHPARVQPIPTLLALSPVPRHQDFPLTGSDGLTPSQLLSMTWSDIARMRRSNQALDALTRAQERVLAPVERSFMAIREQLPVRFERSDLYHELPYDPIVPLIDELQIPRDSALASAHLRLARSLSRLHNSGQTLEATEVNVPIWWIDAPGR